MEVKRDKENINIVLDNEIIILENVDYSNSLIAFLNDQLDDIDSIDELYYQLQDNENIGDLNDWYEFDDDFFNTIFKDDPEKAAKAVYFGNIQSWNDPYIRFNGYGNLETTRYIDYDEYAQEILEQWIDENY